MAHRRRVDAAPVLPSGDRRSSAQYKAVAAYISRTASESAGASQSVPGPVIAANRSTRATCPHWGDRSTPAQTTVNLVEPGTLYGDRLNQVDLRFSKLAERGDGKLDLNVDLYNAFNSGAILTQQNTYGRRGRTR